MKAFPDTFVLIDTETTGMRPATSRIIDIGIIRVEKGEVVERYQTLLNPGRELPSSIEYLTNIHSEDLRDAPLFEEVALEIEELLKGAVFVAHNASFDYRFIQSEFKRIGTAFSAPTLCTVQLSRKLFPQHRGHNLDAIISRHGLTCSSRHRAMPDAEVLLSFFERLSATFAEDALREVVEKVLHGNVEAGSTLYRNSPGAFKDLPDNPGVYFFYGPDDELLYIGKSKNVRTRARSHFHKSDIKKEKYIQQETTAIETISTSGELSALLLESALIKQESPLYNRALRKRRLLVIARREIGEDGYARVTLSRTEAISPESDILGVFKTMTQAKGKLRELAREHRLCAKLLGIENAPGACFGSQIQTCDGACTGKMDPEAYNARVEETFATRKVHIWPYKGPVLITEQENEDAGTIFFVRDWVLLGSFRYDSGEYEPLLEGNDRFDYDHYKILARYMLNTRNRRSIRILTNAEFVREYARCTGSYEAAIY